MIERLDSYTKDEWWDVCRKVRPDWTEEQYEAAWERFQEMKRRKAQQ